MIHIIQFRSISQILIWTIFIIMFNTTLLILTILLSLLLWFLVQIWQILFNIAIHLLSSLLYLYILTKLKTLLQIAFKKLHNSRNLVLSYILLHTIRKVYHLIEYFYHNPAILTFKLLQMLQKLLKNQTLLFIIPYHQQHNLNNLVKYIMFYAFQFTRSMNIAIHLLFSLSEPWKLVLLFRLNLHRILLILFHFCLFLWLLWWWLWLWFRGLRRGWFSFHIVLVFFFSAVVAYHFTGVFFRVSSLVIGAVGIFEDIACLS